MARNNLSKTILVALIVLDAFVWYQILLEPQEKNAQLYFLDVGQGDATLLVLEDGVKILTDAGPDMKVIRSLEKILSPTDRYIDLAVISHPQLDHFNGFNYLLERYRFGAFIVNGRNGEFKNETNEWTVLLEKIKERKIPIVRMAAGDAIKHLHDEVSILSPDRNFIQSGELNDTSIVALVKTPQFRALLTGDIGFEVENYLIKKSDVRAHILKVPHHGSKFSSHEDFLKAVHPLLTLIGVGGKNTYGHPSPHTLARISSSTAAKTFRTDRNGTITILVKENKLKVFTER